MRAYDSLTCHGCDAADRRHRALQCTAQALRTSGVRFRDEGLGFLTLRRGCPAPPGAPARSAGPAHEQVRVQG